jgi:hypothetical protein
MQNRSRTGFNFEPPVLQTWLIGSGPGLSSKIFIYFVDWHGQQEPTDAELGSGGCSASGSRLVSVLVPPTVLVLPEPTLNRPNG